MIDIANFKDDKDLVNSLSYVKQTNNQEEFQNIKIPQWRYKEIKEIVFKFYNEFDIEKLPFYVFDIPKKLGYKEIAYSEVGHNLYEALVRISRDAISVRNLLNNEAYIFYNDLMPKQRINYTIMHEVGHILLGHKEQSDLAEKEANYFAGYVLCPDEIIHGYNIYDPNNLSEVLDISMEVARIRLNLFMKLYGDKINRGINIGIMSHITLKEPCQMDLFCYAQ